MEVFRKTISAVFTGERRYVIPLFQRPYVWTQEYQWEPLWEDIAERAQLELDQPHIETPPHFLGAIVVQQRPSWGDELLAHDVIDGQQRLTTFQILLAAFRDLVAAGDERQVAASLLSWTRNETAIAKPDVEQFKVWPTGRDIDQFQLVMTAHSRKTLETSHPAVYQRKRLLPRPRMVEAYLHFSTQISTWLASDGAEKVGERSKLLRRVLDRRMQLVVIELEKQEDPQTIFETLNARGVPLLASDLLRNYIFQRAGTAAEAERLHAKYWAPFEAPDDDQVADGARFWEVEERQGRLSRARLDLFVQHYLTMKRGTEVISGRLFPTYKAWIEDDHPFASLDAELREFSVFAEHFRRLLRPLNTTRLGCFAGRLRTLDTSTSYPLVLGILGHARLTNEDRENIFRDLESFLVRRLICGRPNKNYNRLFLQVLRDFERGEATAAAFHDLLAAGTGETVDWPDDTTFEKAWNTIDAYTEVKPAKVEMILSALEAAMTKSTTEVITIHSKLTVEHVLPQEWAAHWPLVSTDHQDVDATGSVFEDVLHDFGNLTLLTKPLNSSVSNGPAAQKLPKIALDSRLRLNSYFQGRTSWSPEDIRARSAVLFRIAQTVWPGP